MRGQFRYSLALGNCVTTLCHCIILVAVSVWGKNLYELNVNREPPMKILLCICIMLKFMQNADHVYELLQFVIKQRMESGKLTII